MFPQTMSRPAQYLNLCCLNAALDLNVFSHELQGSAIPSKWWVSMWSLMVFGAPSFPHILQILALLCVFPSGTIFWPWSIIDFTCASSSCKSAETCCETVILCSVLLSAIKNCLSLFKLLKSFSGSGSGLGALTLPCSVVQLSLGGYQMKEFFVLVFMFRFMCRYCRLSWCYSCRHRWQLWPSSLGDNLYFIWLQMLKPYLNILRLGGGQGAGVGHRGILEYELPLLDIVCFDF